MYEVEGGAHELFVGLERELVTGYIIKWVNAQLDVLDQKTCGAPSTKSSTAQQLGQRSSCSRQTLRVPDHHHIATRSPSMLMGFLAVCDIQMRSSGFRAMVAVECWKTNK